MRRLSILFATFGIAWFALGHIAQSADPATFILRDGLLIATLAAFFFALDSTVAAPLASRATAYQTLILPVLIFLLAIGLRLWQLSTLPADCIGEECTRALQLAETGPGGVAGWLSAFFWQISQDGIFSLRLTSALLGSLTVMAFYGLACQISTPTSALIGTLVLAINPWHLWLSRSGEPSGSLILTTTLCLWALLALANRSSWRRWSALGLLVILFVVEFLASDFPQPSPSLLRSFLHATTNDLATPFSSLPLLPPFLSALAICGFVVAVRHGKKRNFALVIGVTLTVIVLIWLAFVPSTLLLPVVFLLATVALDPLLNTLLKTWQPLVQPQNLFALALLTTLLIAGRGTLDLLTQLDGLRTSEANAVNGAMARYLLTTADAEPQTIFFTPPSLRFDPAAQLLLGARLQSDQIRSIDPSMLPFTERAAGDVLFLLPSEQFDLLSLLQQLYPLARLEPQINTEGTANFNVLRLSPDALAAQQPLPFVGLTGTYYPGKQLQGMVLAQHIDPLPGYPVDLPTPYSVLWTGKIAAVRSGEYLLGILADGSVGMIVDGVQIIASTSSEPSDDTHTLKSLHEGTIFLERGWHALEIRYTPEVPLAPLKLYWQPPGSGPSPLRSDFLNPSTNMAEQPPIYGNMLPLADERLGTVDGFALTMSVDLWQSVPQSANVIVSPLVAEIVWQNATGCGSAGGQLNRPHGAAFDPVRAQILVADSDNRRIMAYSLAGQPQQAYSNEAFQEPVDVAMEPNGTLLALDAMTNGIFRIDPATDTTQPLATDTSFYRPRGFAVDSQGMILVADTGGARVVVLNSEGRMMGEFGGPDNALGRGQPADAMALNNIWWALSAENGRIWNLATLGSLGALSYNNTIDGPQMAALPNGSFFVSDPSQQRILYFASTGQPLRQLSGQHAVPTGIAAAVIEGQTYLAVVDSASCSLTLWRVLEL